MSIRELETKMPFRLLMTTQAFITRDKAWSFEGWDDKEWENCIKDAKKELTMAR